MSKTNRFLVALFFALGSLAFFFRATVGIGMVLGLSTVMSIVFAVILAVAIGAFVGYGLLGEKRTLATPSVNRA
jgi:hypothetical protein